MSASKRSKRPRGDSVSWVKKEHRWIGLPITILAFANLTVDTANATDLAGSNTGYALNPADNPFTVVSNAIIDTTVQGGVAIYGKSDSTITWTLANNGVVIGSYFALEFDSCASILNNGSTRSNTTTAMALYSGGNVVNAAGASIIGQFDAVFANRSTSTVTNAGTISGSEDLSATHAGVHLPSGGTVTNSATGSIVGQGPAILANSATTVLNDGSIVSLNGTAIDLSAGATGTGSFVSNSGSINGKGGTAILFGPDDDTLRLTGTAILVGVADGGAGTNTLILGGTSDGRFDISGLGASAQYRGFEVLRKDDSGTWTLTGANGVTQMWLIGGGTVSVAGQLNGSLIAQPGVTGVAIDVLPGGSVQASSGNAVSVNDNGRVVNRGSISSSADGEAAVLATGDATSMQNSGSIASHGAQGIGVSIVLPTGAASLTNEQGGSITSTTGDAVKASVQAGASVSIINAGSIAGSEVGGTGVVIDASTGSASLANYRGASIKGANGVSASTGTHVFIENAGSVAAQGVNGTGVSVDAPGGVASLTNEQGASISSATGVAVLAGSNVSIVNVGAISGPAAAVRFTGSNNRLLLSSGSDINGDLDGGPGSSNALTLNGAGTLSSRTSGFSTLTIQDAGWTVSGPVSITSVSTIRNGELTLTGILASPAITVAPDATLNGTGTLKGALSMQGVIAPGMPATAAIPGLQPLSTGTLSVTGSYTQTPGSGYEADITPQGNDLIAVDGTAELQGGIVRVRLRSASFAPTDTYTILSTTAGLTGVFSGMEALNPFVSASLSYDSHNAYIHVQRGFQFAGGTPNQIAVEAALDHGVAGIAAGGSPTRDFLSIAGDLLSLEGSSAYAALDQLSAEAYAAFSNAHFEAARLGMDAIGNRLNAARFSGECAADEALPSLVNNGRACSWISVLGSTGKLGGYDTWLGQQTSAGGVISGIDYRIMPKVTLGAALAAMHGNTSTSTLPVHGQFDTYQAALYGTYMPGAYWLQASLGYARNSDDMKRSIFFTDTPRTALGSVDGNQYFATLSNGVDVSMGKIGVLSPFVSLEMQHEETPAFSESGADSVNLGVSANAADSIRTSLGARWRNQFEFFGRAWSLNGDLAWVHQYGALTQAVSASFEGAENSAFTVHGSGPARDAMQAGAGVRIALGRQVHAGLRYNGEFGGGGHAHAGSAEFDYRW
jgi:uncharacterized protein with beta-barrel porin domain